MKSFFKKWGFPAAVFAIVILASIVSKTQNSETFMLGQALPWDLGDLLKRVFLYVKTNDLYFSGVSFVAYINLTAIITFSICYVSLAMYGISRKYRSLVMLRYEKKSDYIKHNQKQGIISCTVIIIAILLGVFAGCALTNCREVHYQDVAILIIIALNLFIYFNLIVLISIFFVFMFGDVMSLGIVLLSGMVTVMIDIRVRAISIITYGSMFSLITGLIGLVLIYIIFNFFAHKKIKYMDIL